MRGIHATFKGAFIGSRGQRKPNGVSRLFFQLPNHISSVFFLFCLFVFFVLFCFLFNFLFYFGRKASERYSYRVTQHYNKYTLLAIKQAAYTGHVKTKKMSN